MISAKPKDVFTFFVVTMLCAYLIIRITKYPVIPPALSLTHTLTESVIAHPTLVTFDNSYLSYKEDPLLTRFASYATDSLYLLFFIKIAVFALGLSLLLYSLGGSITGAPLVTLALVSFAGEAQVLITQLMWVPWLGFALVSPALKRIPALLLTLFFSMRLYQTCGEFSLLVSSFVWILCFTKIRHKNFLTALFVFLPSILALVTASSLKLPCYPNDGRLVPDDSLSETLLPFFTTSLPVPSIDRVLIKETLRGFCLGITLLSAVFSLFERSRAMTIATIVAALLFFDLIPSEGTAQLFPLANFSRLYPSLYLYSAVPLLVSFFLITISFARYSLLVVGIVSLSLCYSISKHQQPLYTLSAQKLPLFTQAWKNPSLRKALVTPSFYPLYHHDFNMPLLEGSDYNKLRLWNIPHELHASSAEEDLKFVADDDGSTRWSPKIGIQDGKSWILLKFTKKIPKLLGIQIDSGVFFSDFARGIKISASPHCSSKTDGTFQTLAEHPHWEGSLATTRRSALPYFEYRYHSKIYFQQASIAQCYLIESIGNNNEYDWSIASLIPMEDAKGNSDK